MITNYWVHTKRQDALQGVLSFCMDRPIFNVNVNLLIKKTLRHILNLHLRLIFLNSADISQNINNKLRTLNVLRVL